MLIRAQPWRRDKVFPRWYARLRERDAEERIGQLLDALFRERDTQLYATLRELQEGGVMPDGAVH